MTGEVIVQTENPKDLGVGPCGISFVQWHDNWCHYVLLGQATILWRVHACIFLIMPRGNYLETSLLGL